MTQAQLIKRVEELEREVRLIKLQRGGSAESKPQKTAKDYFGMFHSNRYFKEAMELGAAYRQSLRPKPLGKRGRKK